MGDVINALAKVFPRVVLDSLVEDAIGQDGAGEEFFRDIRSNRACPLDVRAEAVWIAWATEKPTTRYELLARVMRFSSAGDEEHSKVWSSTAAKLIKVCPEPAKVLDIFLSRFMPMGWTGSLADTLASRMALIDVLKGDANPEISGWAEKSTVSFAARIRRERESEARESAARDQSFE
jgi:hypothetical protein